MIHSKYVKQTDASDGKL